MRPAFRTRQERHVNNVHLSPAGSQEGSRAQSACIILHAIQCADRTLQAILTELKLPTTGVKAELTARILEHQEKSATTESASNGDAAAPAPATEAPGESGDAPTKQDSPPAEAAKEAAPETTQKEDGPALPAATDKGSEAEKRAARLKRFGAPAEELAKQDRAARFGNDGAESIDDKVRYSGTAVLVSADNDRLQAVSHLDS